ncbi:uncharacterized protein EI90DRAFT_822064 [Cantharellus anzutake]|uniref:uncharacterized protein n=1 Tax=Cantharellus anzutake TaxID=1750568 RepID=UPI0019065ED9|nr:uncharacterized protein EI90DRAFT_822064 [Cantharellus anzutake]KAF8343032.1 hypothetical protein EI90DRAFT_822064 [Cantharellus anzutake]
MAHGLSSALLEPIDSERQMYLEGGDGDDVEIDWSQTPILHHLDFGYRQFSIDPEQNLVIYVCHDSDRMIVRIRQMSDNAFHPMARYETLDIRWMLRGDYIYLEIFGDFVGVMILQYGDRNHHFSIWNWKTGICQCRLSDSIMGSFLFLSPRHFIILKHEEDSVSLAVYSFRPCYYDGPPVKPCLPSQHVATFQLPNFLPESAYSFHIELYCRPSPVFEAPEYEVLFGGDSMPADGAIPSMPSPSSSVQDSSATPINPPKWGGTYATNGPFVRPRQDDFRVAVFSLSLNSSTGDGGYKMFIAVSDIYRMTKRFESDFHTSGKILDDDLDVNSDADCALPIHVPWDDWGPRSARLLETADRKPFCSIFMNRHIFSSLERMPMSEMTREDPRQAHQRGSFTRLHMLDFNPYSAHAGSIGMRDNTDSDDRIEHGADAERWSGNEGPSSSSSIRPPRISKDYRVSGRMETRLEPTVLPSRKVTTGLPYREVTSDDTLQGDMFPMIDAERILLFDRDQAAIKVLVI